MVFNPRLAHINIFISERDKLVLNSNPSKQADFDLMIKQIALKITGEESMPHKVKIIPYKP